MSAFIFNFGSSILEIWPAASHIMMSSSSMAKKYLANGQLQLRLSYKAHDGAGDAD